MVEDGIYLCQFCGSANVDWVEIADAMEVLTCLECNGVQKWTEAEIAEIHAEADRLGRELEFV